MFKPFKKYPIKMSKYFTLWKWAEVKVKVNGEEWME